jgi:transcriptional regulator with XRE-family HTH domain
MFVKVREFPNLFVHICLNNLFMFDIKRFRKERKMTQAEFADQLGYSRTAVSNMETGNHSVSDKFLDKIEEVFGVDLTEFKSYIKKSLVNESNGTNYKIVNWREKYYTLMDEYYELLREVKALNEKMKENKEVAPE